MLILYSFLERRKLTTVYKYLQDKRIITGSTKMQPIFSIIVIIIFTNIYIFSKITPTLGLKVNASDNK